MSHVGLFKRNKKAKYFNLDDVTHVNGQSSRCAVMTTNLRYYRRRQKIGPTVIWTHLTIHPLNI